MAYYLMTQKKSKYEAIDITKSQLFQRFSKYKEIRLSLQEIDWFTMMFNNEEELKEHLLNEGIIDLETINSPLSIRMKKKSEYKKVPYELLYQKDLEYIMEPKLLIQRIENKLIEEDFKFLQHLGNHYFNSRYCGFTAFDIRRFASDSIQNNLAKAYFYRQDENGDSLLVRMIKLIIYESYQDEKGYVIYKKDQYGNFIIKYRELHVLLAYLNHYEDKENKTVREDKTGIKPKTNVDNTPVTYSETIFDIADRTVNSANDDLTKKELKIVDPKKRTLKKHSQIEGQFTLFE